MPHTCYKSSRVIGSPEQFDEDLVIQARIQLPSLGLLATCHEISLVNERLESVPDDLSIAVHIMNMGAVVLIRLKNSSCNQILSILGETLLVLVIINAVCVPVMRSIRSRSVTRKQGMLSDAQTGNEKTAQMSLPVQVHDFDMPFKARKGPFRAMDELR